MAFAASRTIACVAAMLVAVACANLGSFEDIAPTTNTEPTGSTSSGSSGDADGSNPGASSSTTSSSSSSSTSGGSGNASTSSTSSGSTTSSGGDSGSGNDANASSSGAVDSGPQCAPGLKPNGAGCDDKAECCSTVCNEERKCNDSCKSVGSGGCSPYGDDCCLGGYCVLGFCKQCLGIGADTDLAFGSRSCCSGSASLAGKCN